MLEHNKNIRRAQGLKNVFGILSKEDMEFIFSRLLVLSPASIENDTDINIIPIVPSSRMAKPLLDLIEASDFLAEARGQNYAISWFKEKRVEFHGLSPFEMCLAGEADSVMKIIRSEELA